MFKVDLPVSLNVSLRSSPLSRLMPLNEASCAVVVIWLMMLLYCLTKLERMVCEAASAVGRPPAASAAVSVPPIAMLFGAAVVPRVSVWLALSLLEVRVMDPLTAKDAVNPRPAADSAVLKASIELTLTAAVPSVMVVTAPAAGVKMKVFPLSEFVPPTVRSLAVPTTPSGPAPVRQAGRRSLYRETGGRLQHLV